MTPVLVDLSREQPNPPLNPDPKRPPYRLTPRGKVVVRDAKTICGIGIHQTAVVFGPKADRARAHRRALNVHAHMTAFHDGVVVLGHPPLWYVNHGNGLNAFTYGLECEGAPNGQHNKHELTDDAIATFRFAVDQLIEIGKGLGSPVEYIWAHRQSSDSRRGDPGAEIWQRVVLEHAVAKRGLKTENWKTFRDAGAPIPRDWDPASTAKY